MSVGQRRRDSLAPLGSQGIFPETTGEGMFRDERSSPVSAHQRGFQTPQPKLG